MIVQGSFRHLCVINKHMINSTFRNPKFTAADIEAEPVTPYSLTAGASGVDEGEDAWPKGWYCCPVAG